MLIYLIDKQKKLVSDWYPVHELLMVFLISIGIIPNRIRLSIIKHNHFILYRSRQAFISSSELMEVFNMTKRFNATQINAELFWKFPKFLSENKKYANLTNDDRVAYMLIKDRYRYSLSNNWIDKDKNVYVYFTIEELRQLLHIGKNKVTRVKNRLIDAGLLEIEKGGFNPKDKKNYPDRIY